METLGSGQSSTSSHIRPSGTDHSPPSTHLFKQCPYSRTTYFRGSFTTISNCHCLQTHQSSTSNWSVHIVCLIPLQYLLRHQVALVVLLAHALSVERGNEVSGLSEGEEVQGGGFLPSKVWPTRNMSLRKVTKLMHRGVITIFQRKRGHAPPALLVKSYTR